MYKQLIHNLTLLIVNKEKQQSRMRIVYLLKDEDKKEHDCLVS